MLGKRRFLLGGVCLLFAVSIAEAEPDAGSAAQPSEQEEATESEAKDPAPEEVVEEEVTDAPEPSAPVAAASGFPPPGESETEPPSDSESAETVESPAAQMDPPTPIQRTRPLRAAEAMRQKRYDFMRRLRRTAENIEERRGAQPTRVVTKDGVTVLSNIAAEPDVVTYPTEERVAPEDHPPLAVSAEPNAALLEAARRHRATQARRASADMRERSIKNEGWTWLWGLAVVATVLLVPIAALLTRATRQK